ncbi:unknown [Eubacterium sp. CAG:786]|nr:unknown [Eubacterium sp. CAG:786]
MPSTLLTASTTGFPLFISMEATSLSFAVTPVVISVTKIMASARSTASIACSRICARITSSVLGSIPPVSMSMNSRPSHSQRL